MGDGGRGKQRALINKHGPNTPQNWLQMVSQAICAVPDMFQGPAANSESPLALHA